MYEYISNLEHTLRSIFIRSHACYVNIQQWDMETDRQQSERKNERMREREREDATMPLLYCSYCCCYCCFCIYMDVKLFDAGMSPRRFILKFTSSTSIRLRRMQKPSKWINLLHFSLWLSHFMHATLIIHFFFVSGTLIDDKKIFL